jgi:hypothetical protein
MTKRTFAIAFAVALLASVTFAAPSQAGSTTIDVASTILVANGTASDLEVTFNFAPTPGSVVILPGTQVSVTGSSVSGDVLTINYAGVTAGSTTVTKDINFSVDTTASGSYKILSSTATGTATTLGSVSTIVSVSTPEPASMALFGIGITGVIAYRLRRVARNRKTA